MTVEFKISFIEMQSILKAIENIEMLEPNDAIKYELGKIKANIQYNQLKDTLKNFGI